MAIPHMTLGSGELIKKGALDSQPKVIKLPVACPWSMVLSGFLHH
jgi:hypothetical protein